MFFLGSLVALITMSISVALTVLVPLVAKRYVKVDNVLPYILGANITTLGDTMLAAFALDSPSAVRIVLAEVIATTRAQPHPPDLLLRADPQGDVASPGSRREEPRRLAVFTAVLFLLPVTTIAVSAFVG